MEMIATMLQNKSFHINTIGRISEIPANINHNKNDAVHKIMEK